MFRLSHRMLTILAVPSIIISFIAGVEHAELEKEHYAQVVAEQAIWLTKQLDWIESRRREVQSLRASCDYQPSTGAIAACIGAFWHVDMLYHDAAEDVKFSKFLLDVDHVDVSHQVWQRAKYDLHEANLTLRVIQDALKQ